MDINMELGVIAAYICGFALLVIVGKFFRVPAKFMGKLFLNSLFGGVILAILNLILKNFGIELPINIWTSMVTGLLGIPGIVGIVLFL